MKNLNEKDSMIDLINQEKEIMKAYGSFIPEGSSTDLRGLLHNNLKAVESQQFELFEKMRQKGYYQINDAKQQEIKQLVNSYA